MNLNEPSNGLVPTIQTHSSEQEQMGILVYLNCRTTKTITEGHSFSHQTCHAVDLNMVASPFIQQEKKSIHTSNRGHLVNQKNQQHGCSVHHNDSAFVCVNSKEREICAYTQRATSSPNVYPRPMFHHHLPSCASLPSDA